jgi:hypothetical protein
LKKTILALAAALAASLALATPSGVSGSVGSTSAGTATTSTAGAASSGNGTAFTSTSGYQFAGATLDKSASTGWTGSGLGLKTTGQAAVAGTAETAGGAVSYTKTTGSGVAGSLTTGEACADSQGAAGFLTINGAQGSAVGGATSRGQNSAGTASFGDGEALRGNETTNLSAFSASATATKSLFGNAHNYVTSSAVAQSDSTKTVLAPVTLGNGSGFQNSVNYGNAAATSNARAGNACSGSDC